MEKLTIKYVFETIVPAWERVFFHDPETERIALERGNVCLTCEFRNQFSRHRKWGDRCKKCGCPLIALIRSSDKKVCKANKWKE